MCGTECNKAKLLEFLFRAPFSDVSLLITFSKQFYQSNLQHCHHLYEYFSTKMKILLKFNSFNNRLLLYYHQESTVIVQTLKEVIMF